MIMPTADETLKALTTNTYLAAVHRHLQKSVHGGSEPDITILRSHDHQLFNVYGEDEMTIEEEEEMNWEECVGAVRVASKLAIIPFLNRLGFAVKQLSADGPDGFDSAELDCTPLMIVYLPGSAPTLKNQRTPHFFKNCGSWPVEAYHPPASAMHVKIRAVLWLLAPKSPLRRWANRARYTVAERDARPGGKDYLIAKREFEAASCVQPPSKRLKPTPRRILLYIGAGWDAYPISQKHLREAYDEIIYVDALPNKSHYKKEQNGFISSQSVETILTSLWLEGGGSALWGHSGEPNRFSAAQIRNDGDSWSAGMKDGCTFQYFFNTDDRSLDANARLAELLPNVTALWVHGYTPNESVYPLLPNLERVYVPSRFINDLPEEAREKVEFIKEIEEWSDGRFEFVSDSECSSDSDSESEI